MGIPRVVVPNTNLQPLTTGNWATLPERRTIGCFSWHACRHKGGWIRCTNGDLYAIEITMACGVLLLMVLVDNTRRSIKIGSNAMTGADQLLHQYWG